MRLKTASLGLVELSTISDRSTGTPTGESIAVATANPNPIGSTVSLLKARYHQAPRVDRLFSRIRPLISAFPSGWAKPRWHLRWLVIADSTPSVPRAAPPSWCFSPPSAARRPLLPFPPCFLLLHRSLAARGSSMEALLTRERAVRASERTHGSGGHFRTARAKKRARTQRIAANRARSATKRHLVVDAHGIPLAVRVGRRERARFQDDARHRWRHRAHPRQDARQASSPIAQAPCRQGLRRPSPPSGPAQAPHHPRIARCGAEPKNRLGSYRWVGERTLSWLNRTPRA
jgi:hypothetical protein